MMVLDCGRQNYGLQGIPLFKFKLTNLKYMRHTLLGKCPKKFQLKLFMEAFGIGFFFTGEQQSRILKKQSIQK